MIVESRAEADEGLELDVDMLDGRGAVRNGGRVMPGPRKGTGTASPMMRSLSRSSRDVGAGSDERMASERAVVYVGAEGGQ